jgi:predicted MPP superfamily phosphohydrolase
MLNNDRIVIEDYILESRKVASPVTIVHLSDLHEKRFGPYNQNLFFAVREIWPDVIAVTGDLVARERQMALNKAYIKELARGLVGIAPTFFVTGNHEKNLYKEILPLMEEEGVRIASNALFNLNIRGNHINISGMDDVTIDLDYHKSASLIQHAPDGYNVFLTHRPDHFHNLAQYNIDLLLCGHTHAGQIRFPFFGTFYMPGQGWFPKYLQGGFVNQDTTMIISRGMGSSGYPTIRINNPPELVCITLTAKK